jgi:multimeric flavodoxin WrbA
MYTSFWEQIRAPTGFRPAAVKRRKIMADGAINILGITSSPRKGGNMDNFLDYALKAAAEEDGVATEMISLRGLDIRDCVHCNWCVSKQTDEQLCSIKDDALPILEKIRDCHILVLASPVYFMRLSGVMACLVDRSRCFIFGKRQHMALRGKIGVALTVGWERNGGIETTLESLHWVFQVHEMRTVAVHRAGAFLGVGAVSGQKQDRENMLRVLDDKYALRSARIVMQKAVAIAKEIS